MSDIIIQNNQLTTSDNLPSLVNNYKAYKNYVLSIPNLSIDEEKNLINLMCYANETDKIKAVKNIIMPHLKLVLKIAKNYSNYGLPEEDLVQEGNIGLMMSVKNYNPSFNVRIATHAIIYIKSAIQEYILSNWKIVKIATTKSYRKLFFNFRKMKDLIENISTAKKANVNNIIANELGVKPEEVEQIAEYFMHQDSPILQTSDQGDMEILEIPYTETPEISLIKKERAIVLEKIKNELNTLSQTEKQIITARYLIDKKKTYKELSQELGFSDERIRQMEKIVLEKIKNRLGTNKT